MGSLFFAATLWAAAPHVVAPSASDLFLSGNQSYSTGDLHGAIVLWERALAKEPGNATIRSSLALALHELAYQFYNEGRYAAALPHFQRLARLLPDDKDIAALLMTIRRAASAPSPPPGEEAQVIQRGRRLEHKLLSTAAASRRALPPSPEVVSQGRRIEAALAGRLEELERRLQASVHAEVSRAQVGVERRLIIWAVLLGGLVLAVGAWLWGSMRLAERRLWARQERLIRETVGQVPALAAAGPSLMWKARDLEVVEAELVKQPDSETALRIIMPFLDHPEAEVRARAGRSILRYLFQTERDMALDIVGRMVEDPDPEARLAVLPILEDSSAPEIAPVLSRLARDPDAQVRRRASKALGRLTKTSNFAFTPLDKSGGGPYI